MFSAGGMLFQLAELRTGILLLARTTTKVPSPCLHNSKVPSHVLSCRGIVGKWLQIAITYSSEQDAVLRETVLAL